MRRPPVPDGAADLVADLYRRLLDGADHGHPHGAGQLGQTALLEEDLGRLLPSRGLIPEERMKAKREHRIPLGKRAVEVLREGGAGAPAAAPRAGVHERRRERIDASVVSKMVARLGIDAVPHGFRSSFRDWASERTDHPREVVEAALAHTVRDQTEAAYARSDLFERRRHLMDDWAEYLAEPRGQVVSLGR